MTEHKDLRGTRGEASSPEPDSPPTAARPPRDPDLKRAIRRFIEAQRAPRTRVEYEKAIGYFLAFAEISTFKGLLRVSSEEVVSYRNDLQARGISASSVTVRLAAISGLYGNQVIEGRLPGNPADPKLVKRFKVSGVSRTEGLTPEEVGQILETCDGTLRGLRDRAILMTLYYEGLRRSEAAKLCYRDLTTKRGLLIIRNAKSSEYEEIRLKDHVRTAIEDYLEVLCRELKKLGTKPDDPVFVAFSRRCYGKRLTPVSINNIVKARARAAGIKRRITAHSWRHTTTTHSLQAGTSLHQVQRHLRHKDVRTTLRYDRERDVRKNPTIDGMLEF